MIFRDDELSYALGRHSPSGSKGGRRTDLCMSSQLLGSLLVGGHAGIKQSSRSVGMQCGGRYQQMQRDAECSEDEHK